MEVPQSNFGLHLTVDGYYGNKKRLNDIELIYKFLDELPAKVYMRKLMPPYVIYVPPVSKKDTGGISGFVIIAESHVSIHTFPDKGFATIDIYTCKNELNIKTIKNYIKKLFLFKDMEVNLFTRGKNFPN